MWFVGLDVGTTAIAATLFNIKTAQLYPIHWVRSGQPDSSSHLPLIAVNSGIQHSFKPYLNVAIPYRSAQTNRWEPMLKGSDNQEIHPLQIQVGLMAAIKSLAGGLLSDGPSPSYTAEGLSPAALKNALTNPAGIAISQPIGSSDAYRFNLREAVLHIGWVSQPDQIFFLEEAIAALLAELHSLDGTNQPESAPGSLTGGILVVSAGATTTDLALLKQPHPQRLSRQDISLRRIPYAGNALDQDIICQLLYPTAADWKGLNIGDLNLPLPGEPDLEARYRLQQRLESSELGRSLLQAVRRIKPALGQGDVSLALDASAGAQLAGSHWALQHQDLQNWVIAPYLQQLNRELNLLLSQSSMNPVAIQRVICIGGTASMPAIAHWLQQKFLNAQVIQRAVAEPNASDTSRDRIAGGLALFPRYPQVLDIARHQYSEYFLLQELLRAIPQNSHPLSATRILQLLEARNIPPDICQPIILNLLEGQLPTGLVPTRASLALLTPESRQNPDYQALQAIPLFTRQDSQLYQLNLEQRDRLLNHLQAILANTRQALTKPLNLLTIQNRQS